MITQEGSIKLLAQRFAIHRSKPVHQLGDLASRCGERPSRQVLWRRTDVVWPHHFVVLVLDDVAMPDIKARQVE